MFNIIARFWVKCCNGFFPISGTTTLFNCDTSWSYLVLYFDINKSLMKLDLKFFIVLTL